MVVKGSNYSHAMGLKRKQPHLSVMDLNDGYPSLIRKDPSFIVRADHGRLAEWETGGATFIKIKIAGLNP